MASSPVIKARLERVEPEGIQDWRGVDGRHRFLPTEAGMHVPVIGTVAWLGFVFDRSYRGFIWRMQRLASPEETATFTFATSRKATLIHRTKLKRDEGFLQRWRCEDGTIMIMQELENGLPGAKDGDVATLVLVKQEGTRTGLNWRAVPLERKPSHGRGIRDSADSGTEGGTAQNH